MTTPATPSDPKNAGSPLDVSPDIDEGLHSLGKKYAQPFMIFCCLALVFYIGREGWDYMASRKESGIRQEFAAATTSEQLQTFIAAHPDHPLAGMAQLQIADMSYAGGNFGAAATAYGEAIPKLQAGGPLAGRAQLGQAMAQIQSGQASEGVATLHRLSEDAKQLQPVRAEATYQLASLAASAGRADELKNLSVLLLQIDPNSVWAQRAFGLQVAKPAASASPAFAAPAPAPGAAPAIQFKPVTH